MTILTVTSDEEMKENPGFIRRIIDFGLNLINIIEPSRNTTLYAAAIVVGSFTGLGGFLFIRLIEWIGEFLFGTLPELINIGRAWLIFIPMIGGLIAGPIIAFFAAEAKGHGVPEVLQAIALN